MRADSGLRPLALLAGFGYYALFGGWPDTALLLAFSAWRNRNAVAGFVSDWIDPKAALQHLLLLLPGFALGLLVLGVLRSVLALTEDDADAGKWKTPARPLLIPARTTHRRTFPQKHDFAYSYLVVGIPVGWTGNYAGMISSGTGKQGRKNSWLSWLSLTPSRDGKGWFHVDPAEYLERGNGHLGLRGKLDAYLRSQGADPARYPRAYLVTAAKFLGYSFNPVSFWYLYSEDGELAAMVLEVNNTFDERRMYFLTSDAVPAEQRVTGGDDEKLKGEAPDDEQQPVAKRSTTARMTKHWSKDFHVSPFNSRKGSYSLSAADFFTGGDGTEREPSYNLDTTITLKSSKDHPKLVARLFSSAPPVDPGTMSFLQKLAFLCRWWWVGFVTFPRIVREAAALFFRRGLHVWYRPEPLRASVGRRADATERRLEPFFRAYLRHLVERSPAALAVTYVPSGVDADSAPAEVMLSSAAAKQKSTKRGAAAIEELEFRVLTPAFYARFVRYAHDLEAVCCEFQDNRTIWVSRPDLLPRLVLRKPAPPLRTTNILDFVYFGAIRALRRPPERIERPLTSSAGSTSASKAGQGQGQGPNVQKVDIRDFRMSSMDAFVLSRAGAAAAADGDDDAKAQSAIYRSLVLRSFLADRIALGSVELLGLQHLVLRAGFAWVLSSVVAPLLLAAPVTL